MDCPQLLLFVIIMPISSKNENKHSVIKDAVHQTVLLGNVTTPPSFRLSLKRFRVTGAGFGMHHQFGKHSGHFLERLGLTMLKLLHVPFSFVGIFQSICHELQTVKKCVELLGRGDAMRLSLSVLLFAFFNAGKELLTTNQRGVILFFCNQFAQIFGCSP